jgi:tripartite-type tricarboxylate transporter receptor subunit TctC
MTMIAVNRRGWLSGGAALVASAGVPRCPAWAQAAPGPYPQRPVKIIVPYAPGGGTDVFSRLLAAQMEAEFGQPLVIDNRAGGASVIGTQAIVTAEADGYTIGMVDSALVTNPGLLKDKLPYDTRRDLVPVSLLARTQLVLSVLATSPFKTAPELIAHAKANPGKLNFASAGIGTGIHLAGEQFRQIAGVDFVTVQYRGGGPAITDFLAGHVDFTFGTVPAIREHVLAGKVRGLGVTRGRAPQLPDVASMNELKLSAVDSASEMGLVVPAATPAAIVEKLQALTVKAVKSAGFANSLFEQGFQPIGSTQAEFQAHIDREIEKWVRIIAAGDVKAP